MNDNEKQVQKALGLFIGWRLTKKGSHKLLSYAPFNDGPLCSVLHNININIQSNAYAGKYSFKSKEDFLDYRGIQDGEKRSWHKELGEAWDKAVEEGLIEEFYKTTKQ